MLKHRVFTAIIGIPILIGVLFYGPWWLFLGFLAVFVGISVFEVSSMVLPKVSLMMKGTGSKQKYTLEIALLVMFGVLCFLFLSLGAIGYFSIPPYSKSVFFLPLLLSILILFAVFKKSEQLDSEVFFQVLFGRMACYLLCICYGAILWLALWGLYVLGDMSAKFFILLLVIVWCGDTGAYFAGGFFGKNLLAKRLSPKKTWEGAVGGFVASILGAVILNFVYFSFSSPLADWSLILLVGALGTVFGQMGDLVESAIKRFAGVKDSGKIFPGHGGVLDRVDALLFAAPVIWLILIFA